MKNDQCEKRDITPIQAANILAQHGTHVTEKEAEIILDFLYFLGKLTVDQYIKENTTDKDT
jgi:hypothetical protein